MVAAVSGTFRSFECDFKFKNVMLNPIVKQRRFRMLIDAIDCARRSRCAFMWKRKCRQIEWETAFKCSHLAIMMRENEFFFLLISIEIAAQNLNLENAMKLEKHFLELGVVIVLRCMCMRSSSRCRRCCKRQRQFELLYRMNNFR